VAGTSPFCLMLKLIFFFFIALIVFFDEI
jgi:hypothetical protein